MNINIEISTNSVNSYIVAVQKIEKLKACKVVKQDIRTLSLTFTIKDISVKIQPKIHRVLSTIPEIKISLIHLSTTISLGLPFNSYRNALCTIAKLNGNPSTGNTINLADKIMAISHNNKIDLRINMSIGPISLSLEDIYSVDFPLKYEHLIKSHIHSSLSDIYKLDELQEKEAQELLELLKGHRNEGGFTYKRFILSNIYLINDYSVIRKALKLYHGDGKTLEKAITITRRVLKELEEKEGLVFYSSNDMVGSFLQFIV